MLPSQERKQFLSIIEMLSKGCSNEINSKKLLERVKVKNNITEFISLDIASIWYKIFVLIVLLLLSLL